MFNGRDSGGTLTNGCCKLGIDNRSVKRFNLNHGFKIRTNEDHARIHGRRPQRQVNFFARMQSNACRSDHIF